MLIGYARVSTEEQNLELQLDALKRAGCDEIFSDRASGSRIQRPGVEQALDKLQRGDCLVVWKLDRLGRSVKDLVSLADRFRLDGVDLRCLSDGIDTSTSTGRFFFHVMSAFAEMERELIRERTKAGLVAAASRGRKGGRPRAMTEEKRLQAQAMLSEGQSVAAVAEQLQVSSPTIYRYFPGNGSAPEQLGGVA